MAKRERRGYLPRGAISDRTVLPIKFGLAGVHGRYAEARAHLHCSGNDYGTRDLAAIRRHQSIATVLLARHH